MKEVIKITGMSCNHCKDRVEKKLKTAEGVKDVTVDLKNSEAIVDIDESKTNSSKLKEIINSLGYKALL